MKCYPTSATRVFLQIPLIQHGRQRKLGSCSVERGCFHFKEDFFSSQYLLIPPIITQPQRSAFEPRKWCRDSRTGLCPTPFVLPQFKQGFEEWALNTHKLQNKHCCCHYWWFVSLIQVLHLKERSIHGWVQWWLSWNPSFSVLFGECCRLWMRKQHFIYSPLFFPGSCQRMRAVIVIENIPTKPQNYYNRN